MNQTNQQVVCLIISNKEKTMSKIVIVAGLKGGIGKSLISLMVLPLFAYGKAVYVYEIDSSNRTILKQSRHVNFKTFTVEEADSAIIDIDFKLLSQQDALHIIDVGGGMDTRIVIEHIAKSDLDNLTFVLPTNDDFEQVDTVKESILIIKKHNKNAKIHLILNRVYNMNEEKIKTQFPSLFGSQKYGIKPRIDEIENDINSIHFLPNSSIFGIVKNLYHRTLLDSYREAQELTENISEYKSKWAKEGGDVFKEKMVQYYFAKDIVELVKEIQPLKEIVHNEGVTDAK